MNNVPEKRTPLPNFFRALVANSTPALFFSSLFGLHSRGGGKNGAKKAFVVLCIGNRAKTAGVMVFFFLLLTQFLVSLKFGAIFSFVYAEEYMKQALSLGGTILFSFSTFGSSVV